MLSILIAEHCQDKKFDMPIDYRNYPKDWKQRRKRILNRDKHKCTQCGVPNYSVIVRKEGTEYTLIARCASYQEAIDEKHKQLIVSSVDDQVPAKMIIIVLTVAHLDHDEWNHQVKDNRLATFCQRCHFHYDEADNQKRKLYGRQYARHQLNLFKTPII